MINRKKKNQESNVSQAAIERKVPPAESTAARGSRGKLKVAIDAHADSYSFCPMYEGQVPKPVQKLGREALLEWLSKQARQGWEVVTCYEAGPLGYGLHRELAARGIRNLVIRPRNWDDQRRRVRTDRTDTRSMLVALDRYEAGQKEAFTVVRVPTPEQEARRQYGRLLATLRQETRRLAQSGRGHALFRGYRLRGVWYGPRRWGTLESELPRDLVEVLQALRAVIQTLVEQARQVAEQIRQARLAGESRPVGAGDDTLEALEREVGDWNRFTNRRKVGSFFGLTPGESSSGPSRCLGSISRCGNPRVRRLAVEVAWRLIRYQPDYVRVRKWRERCLSEGVSPGKRRKLVVGLAREFLIDWWRMRTGRTTAEKLGWKLRAAEEPVAG